MRATWYVLEDGTAVDPSECVADEMGNVLTHKRGTVAMRAPGVPMSRGVDIDEPDNQPAPPPSAPAPAATPPATNTQMQPAPSPKPAAKRPGYKTRQVKSR